MAAEAERPSSQRRALPLGGIILLIVGIILLLQTTGIIPWTLWFHLWRFWPVLLIAVGVHLILGRRMPVVAALAVGLLLAGSAGAAYAFAVQDEPPGLQTVEVNEPLDNLEAADVRMVFGAGELRLGSLPEDSTSLIEGTLRTPGGEAEVTLTSDNGRGSLVVEHGARRWFPGTRAANWDVSLSRTPALSLDVDGGAASMNLDLRDLRVDRLDLDVGAADVQLTLPSQGETAAAVRAGAANVDVTVPEGVATRITRESGLASFDIDTGRFPRDGNVYESPDYDTAEHRVDLVIQVGASSVTVR